jgi:hypothetical protein
VEFVSERDDVGVWLRKGGKGEASIPVEELNAANDG